MKKKTNRITSNKKFAQQRKQKVNKVQRYSIDQEKIFANHALNKESILKIRKEFKKLNSKITKHKKKQIICF
jgi:hypothetical protein